jgi:hypothetical protein
MIQKLSLFREQEGEMGPPYGNEGEGEDADGDPLVLHVHHLRGVRLPHALNTHMTSILGHRVKYCRIAPRTGSSLLRFTLNASVTGLPGILAYLCLHGRAINFSHPPTLGGARQASHAGLSAFFSPFQGNPR